MNRNHAFDVVVIGGGVHGLTYATWLKKGRPETSIAIVERKVTPGFKVGESTLSSAKRNFIAMGLSMPILRRLFGTKAGLRFWWTDPHTDALHRHVDVVDIEETFQVERRVLDMALQETARRRGITLFTGARVNLKKSDVDSETKTIVCEDGEGAFTLTCRMLADASGPASVLARHKKLYRKAPERNQTFTTNAYFAYFKPKTAVPLRFWEDATTRHLCFPEGWMWLAPLTSWEQTPDENLQRMIRHLLDHEDGPDACYPTREALSRRFGCTTEQLVSVGFVIRADRDQTKGMSVADRFRHYGDKHPAIAWVMDYFELVEQPYGGRAPYQAFTNLVHHSERVAGDGWCLVGDAAAFTNPLFSPGLNLGSGSCYLAAKATVEALSRGNLSRPAFAAYEQYMADIYDALLNEADLYHRAFDHVDSYEWALLLKIVFGTADVVPRGLAYTETDPFVHDLLNPRFRDRVDATRTVLREGEEAGRLPAETAAAVRAIIEPFVKDVLAQPHVKKLDLGQFFSQYTSDGVRVEHKEHPRPAFGLDPCEACGSTIDNRLERCPACGNPPTCDRTVTHRKAA